MNLLRIPSLKTVGDFRHHAQSLGLNFPCADSIRHGHDSPLLQAFAKCRVNGKLIGNRVAIQPMEGWDATTDGRPSAETFRRWERFGQSGAKLIYGGEAMAIRPDGRANPNQLLIARERIPDLQKLQSTLVEAHRASFGNVDDLVVGFQLTHSGRFCRPNDKTKLEPQIAYRHPILDPKFGIEDDRALLSDVAVELLVQDYVTAAQVAREAGADFVDIKHCHGYLLHEFLSAFTRPGKYGGSFENRTRILREIVSGIRAAGNPIDLAVRLSAFDFVPFKPDPALSSPGKLGPGVPEDFSGFLPYRFAFGVNQEHPVEYDLSETFRFAGLCQELGIKILNLTAGSPYYNPHIQRPAAYPPSDGYQPAHDPLIDVWRQLDVTRQVRGHLGDSPAIALVGSAYTYLQDFLPHVAQGAVEEGWADFVGLGRMALSYPRFLQDAVSGTTLAPKLICRTFSDCTTAPRNGLISGCYPLDRYYSARPEFQQLKDIKRRKE